jgi:hypothetical protein
MIISVNSYCLLKQRYQTDLFNKVFLAYFPLKKEKEGLWDR